MRTLRAADRQVVGFNVFVLAHRKIFKAPKMRRSLNLGAEMSSAFSFSAVTLRSSGNAGGSIFF